MANRYIIDSALFNGDGTTTAEAASAGAAGAWNHIDIIAGTATGFGTLSAGDVVYIRSKTGAGLNLNVTYNPLAAKNYGSSSGTSASPITWILDNGIVWSGINGTLTLTASTSAMTQTFVNFNDFIANTPYNFIVEHTAASPSFNYLTFNQNNTYGLKISVPNSASGSGWNMIFTSGNVLAPVSKHTNLYIYMAAVQTTVPPIMIGGSRVYFINPTIEVTGIPATLSSLTTINGNHGKMDIRGGRIFGAGIDSGLMALAGSQGFYGYGNDFTAIGTQITKVAPLTKGQLSSSSVTMLAGLDGGGGSAIELEWGNADSRNITNNYPTLNATLADSVNTPTSWRLYPKYANKQTPFEMPIAKLYTATAATKIVTFHFLATTGWAGSIPLNLSNLWIDVIYTDNTTGLLVYQTTKVDVGGGALTTSGLTWTPSNAWGAVSLTAYKLSLTTGTAIKKDTTVNVSFSGFTTSGNANDIFIFCPDIQLS